MKKVTVQFLNSHKAFAFYTTGNKVKLVSELMNSGDYSKKWEFEKDGTDEDICEYAFDVTNDPSRQDECEKVYGRGRSLSVGDIVTVNEISYVCDNVGWLKVSQ